MGNITFIPVASQVGFSPSGNISSTNTQNAVAEVDNEKVAKTGDTMTGSLIVGVGALSNIATSPNSLVIATNIADVQPRFLADGYGSGTSGQGNFIFRKARIVAGNRSAILNGDIIGQFSWFGYGSTQYANTSSAQIRSIATENFSDTSIGALLAFVTVNNGTATASVKAGIDNDGTVYVGDVPSGNTVIYNNRIFRLRQYTVATLPAAGTPGRLASVSDALAPTYNATVVGGGAINIPVYDNGTNWVAH